MVPPENEEVAILAGRDRERLLNVIEFSLNVRRRQHFHQWAQGQFQSLVPHEILYCAYGDPARRDLKTVRICANPAADLGFDPNTELLLPALDVWHARGNRPLSLAPEADGPALPESLRSVLRKLEPGHCAVHGTQGFDGVPGNFFAFARMPSPLTPRRAYLLDLVLPHLQSAFLRTLGQEDRHERRAPTPRPAVTPRERQILQWVHEGKSNREIGEVLGISPLTVKNHVQSILKKLRAQNRAQAVGRAPSLKIIQSQHDRLRAS